MQSSASSAKDTTGHLGDRVHTNDDDQKSQTAASHGEHSKTPSEDDKEKQLAVATQLEAGQAPAAQDDIQGPVVLSAKRFIPIYVGLLLAVLIISLDNTVIATAQVSIVDDLGGADLIAWLPTTFLVGQGAFALFWGQVLGSFPSKHVMMLNVFLFELGSLVAALAPNMGAVLAGRTISGIGAAGMMSAAVQILAENTSLEQRAVYIGMLGSIFSISMIAGPLIGGALTKVSWRWVFWINLPIGGVALFIVLILSPTTRALGTSKTKSVPFLQRIAKIDIVGTALLACVLCAVIVPLQEGPTLGWSSFRVWLPFCFAFVFAGLFYAWICYLGESRALLSRKMLHDRNLWGCAMASFLIFWTAIMYMYLIPYYYQTVRGHTPTKSGVDMLALMITVGLCAIVGGVIARKTRHYFPQMVFFPLLGAVGAGLSYTTTVNSGTGLQIGSQILLGLGMGMVIQAPLLTVQANTERQFISKATAFVIYSQRFGGGVGSSVSNAILYAQLPSAVRSHLSNPADIAQYQHILPNAIYDLPLGPTRDALLRALTSVIDKIYIVGVPVFITISLVVLLLVKMTNIETRKVTTRKEMLRFVMGNRKAEGPSPA